MNFIIVVVVLLFIKFNKCLKVLSFKNNYIESFLFENIDNLFKIKSLIFLGNK